MLGVIVWGAVFAGLVGLVWLGCRALRAREEETACKGHVGSATVLRFERPAGSFEGPLRRRTDVQRADDRVFDFEMDAL